MHPFTQAFKDRYRLLSAQLQYLLRVQLLIGSPPLNGIKQLELGGPTHKLPDSGQNFQWVLGTRVGLYIERSPVAMTLASSCQVS